MTPTDTPTPRPAGGDRAMPRPTHTLDCASQMANADGERYECDCRRRYTPAAPAPEAGREAKSVMRLNAEADPTYRPYCMRCPGVRRMGIVGPFLWRCSCGAEHDERRPEDTPARPAPAPDDAAAHAAGVEVLEVRAGQAVYRRTVNGGWAQAADADTWLGVNVTKWPLLDALAAARAREGAVERSLVMVADGSLALEATCALCGHEWRRHDPESGCCDAPHPTEARVCPCGRDLAWMQAHIAEQSTAALRRARDGEGRGDDAE